MAPAISGEFTVLITNRVFPQNEGKLKIHNIHMHIPDAPAPTMATDLILDFPLILNILSLPSGL